MLYVESYCVTHRRLCCSTRNLENPHRREEVAARTKLEVVFEKECFLSVQCIAPGLIADGVIYA